MRAGRRIKRNRVNTVYIIGAGASAEVNLPTGEKLKQRISELLNLKFGYRKQTQGDHEIGFELENHAQNNQEDFNTYYQACNHISEVLLLTPSIDNFIDAHKNDVKLAFCAKLAIIKSIIEAERSSNLFFNKLHNPLGFDFKKIELTWYLPFFQILMENCELEDFKKRLKEISFIVFNYDRCVEQFLFYAIQSLYRISIAEAKEIIEEISIYHPYGSVGKIDYTGQDDGVSFGRLKGRTSIIDLAKQIRTFTEGTDPNSSEINSIKSAIKSSDRLVFIGFGFHKLNLNLLQPEYGENEEARVQRCYATAYGISKSDQVEIEKSIRGRIRGVRDVIFSETTCYDFFGEFRRSLGY